MIKLRDIHFKVDDEMFEEWMAIGKMWRGVRSHLMRRKVREVIEELKKSPMLQFKEEKKNVDKQKK